MLSARGRPKKKRPASLVFWYGWYIGRIDMGSYTVKYMIVILPSSVVSTNFHYPAITRNFVMLLSKAMSMVLYRSPEVGYIVMDSLPENNTNDVYGISIWYFC